MQEAVRRAPWDAQARVHHATYLDTDSAVRELRTAISVKPDYPLAHFELGYRLYWSERYEDAIHEFETAARLDPQHHASYAPWIESAKELLQDQKQQQQDAATSSKAKKPRF